MKKKDFRTRTCKVLSTDINIFFRGRPKVICKKLTAIEITEEEFDNLKTKKNPFKDYNTANIKYNTFIIPNKYGKGQHKIYHLTHVCDKYSGYNRKCPECDKFTFNNCIVWNVYISMSLSSNFYVCPEIEESDNKKYIFNDPIDDMMNAYMFDQLKEQRRGCKDEFIKVDWDI